MEPVARILDEFLGRPVFKNKWKEQHLFSFWKQVAGTDVASITKPLQLKDKVLLIGVKDSAWCYHLQFFKNEYIKKLQGLYPAEKITDIKFTVLGYWKQQQDSGRTSVYHKKVEKKDFSKKKLTIENQRVMKKIELTLSPELDGNLRQGILRLVHKDLACKQG